MYPTQTDPLLPKMAAYHAAVVRDEGLQLLLRESPDDGDLLRRSLAAAEAVIAARATFRRALIELGWTPPVEIVEDLEHDTILLDTPAE
jgi:hypothetical protein